LRFDGCAPAETVPIAHPRAFCRCVRQLLSVLAGLYACAALGADLRVLCANALREPVLELARSYARATGDRVEFVFASVGAVHKRIASGERADVAIGTLEGVEALIKLGPGVAGSEAPLARSALAVAVRPGALRTSIGTPQALARTLVSVRTFAAPDARLGVPGGAQVAELIEQLQLTEALEAKMRPVRDARDAVRRVAAGEVDLALAMMSDLVGSAHVEVIGPVTEPPTRGIVYAAVITRIAALPERARRLVVHMQTAEAERVFSRAGYVSPR